MHAAPLCMHAKELRILNVIFTIEVLQLAMYCTLASISHYYCQQSSSHPRHAILSPGTTRYVDTAVTIYTTNAACHRYRRLSLHLAGTMRACVIARVLDGPISNDF